MLDIHTILAWLHILLFLASLVSLVYISVITSQAMYPRIYIASLLTLQVIFDGCILTSLQNYFLERDGMNLLENQFMFGDTVWHRGIAGFLALLLWIYIAKDIIDMSTRYKHNT